MTETERNQTARVALRLTKELKAEFDKALKKNGATQANILRRCIEEYVEKNK